MQEMEKKCNKRNIAITTVRKDLISKDSKQWKKYVWCLSDNLLKYHEINSKTFQKGKITSSAKHTLVVHKKMYILFMLLHAW